MQPVPLHIESRQVQVDWGSALGGIRLDLATVGLCKLNPVA
jgi:hypothetical protein